MNPARIDTTEYLESLDDIMDLRRRVEDLEAEVGELKQLLRIRKDVQLVMGDD